MLLRMEFWAQCTRSPLDGREGWTVVDDRYVEHRRAGEYLRSIVDRGSSVGTARTYAGRALWLGWAADGDVAATANDSDTPSKATRRTR